MPRWTGKSVRGRPRSSSVRRAPVPCRRPRTARHHSSRATLWGLRQQRHSRATQGSPRWRTAGRGPRDVSRESSCDNLRRCRSARCATLPEWTDALDRIAGDGSACGDRFFGCGTHLGGVPARRFGFRNANWCFSGLLDAWSASRFPGTRVRSEFGGDHYGASGEVRSTLRKWPVPCRSRRQAIASR